MNSDNLIGNILNGRYDVIEKIGAGGMASVYKAKDTILNRYVAIKVLRESLEGERNIVMNFVKEAQSAASLTHNNIVSVFDVGLDDDVNYMVMELVDGRTLKDYIKEKGALPWQEACDYIIQIGQGLSEAHAKNIIHRDIKPQNIIMTQDKTMKVTDFGIAKALSSDTTIVGGTALGSVHYISPEQARGGFTDARSDIYSLGIVLYELLTGKVPFNGETAVSVALMHLEKEPINVKCVNIDIPQDLAYVTMKAIAKEQAKRYQTVAEMLEDIHAVLADEPLVSKDAMTAPDKVVGEEDYADDVYDDYDYDDYEDDFEEDEEEVFVSRSARAKTKKPTKQSKSKKAKKAKKQKTPQQKKADRLATLMAFATVLLMILVAIGAYFIMNSSRDVTIPDVTNMTLEEATVKIVEKGLRVADEIEYSISDSTEEGRVITQSPESGRKLRKGEDVSLVVSIGTSGGDISVPDVTKMAFDEAINKISDKGLNYAVIEEYSDEIEEGKIIRQTPLKGTKLNENDIVTLHVSRGKETVNATPVPEAAKIEVPSLNGEGKEGAEAKLQEVGLTLGGITYKHSGAAEGLIISQSPQAGKMVEKGGVVNVVISRGQEEVEATEVAEATKAPSEGSGSAPEKDIDDANNTTNNTASEGSSKSFTVKIPDAAGDTVNVQIVANGRAIHNALHNKSEGSVTVQINGTGTVSVQAYIDGSKVSDKTVEFD